MFFFYQKSGKERANIGVRAPYMRVVGIHVDSTGIGFSSSIPTTPDEEDAFRRLAATPNIYDRISRSIAPSIFGAVDIKKAIACLLFGGLYIHLYRYIFEVCHVACFSGC